MAETAKFALCPGLYTSFTKGHVRCIRQGVRTVGRREGHGPRVTLPNCVQLVEPGKRAWLAASVYMVTLSDERLKWWTKQPKTFYVVAETDKAAQSYLESRYTKIAKRFEGSAKYALTAAMMKLSTRGGNEGKMGPSAKRVGGENVAVNSFGGKDEWNVEVIDSLSYATAALKSGPSGVTFAIMKASNAIAGYLRSKAVDVFDPDIATPFPEIARGGSRR